MNSYTAALVVRKMARCAGTLRELQLEPSYLLRLRYSYDLAFDDRHSVGWRAAGMGRRALERIGFPLDFVDRREHGLCHRLYCLDPFRRSRRCSSAASLAAGIELDLDPSVRCPFPPRLGRTEPAAAHAHVPPGCNVGAGILDRDPGSRGVLPPQPPLGPGWNRRRVPGDGLVLVLLRVGTDAGSHVFPDRDLGSRTAGIRGGEVLHLHAAQRVADADRDPGSLFRPSHRDWHLHV